MTGGNIDVSFPKALSLENFSRLVTKVDPWLLSACIIFSWLDHGCSEGFAEFPTDKVYGDYEDIMNEPHCSFTPSSRTDSRHCMWAGLTEKAGGPNGWKLADCL